MNVSFRDRKNAFSYTIQIVQERIANVLRQRETGLTAALAGNNKRGVLPVDIGEAQSDDVTTPKP